MVNLSPYNLNIYIYIIYLFIYLFIYLVMFIYGVSWRWLASIQRGLERLMSNWFLNRSDPPSCPTAAKRSEKAGKEPHHLREPNSGFGELRQRPMLQPQREDPDQTSGV